jgi:hypothetical protein
MTLLASLVDGANSVCYSAYIAKFARRRDTNMSYGVPVDFARKREAASQPSARPSKKTATRVITLVGMYGDRMVPFGTNGSTHYTRSLTRSRACVCVCVCVRTAQGES